MKYTKSTTGWWFGTAVGSTPTSRCGRALQIVERSVHRVVPWTVMDLADVDAGGSSLLWSWWALILCMCATWSSVRDGTGMVFTGLLDGVPDELTLLDVVLVQQFSIPLLKVDDGTKVLFHSLHTWEDFFKLVDACCGLDGPTHGAHAVGVQTMVAVDSSARMVTFHKVHGGCEYVIGDAGCPQVIAGVWSKCNHAAVMSAGFSCQPFSQLGDRKGGADSCAMSLPNNLRAALSQCVYGLVLACVVPACRDPFVSQHLDRFVDWSGVVKENINPELSAIGRVLLLMQNHTQIDGQFLEFTHHQSQQVSILQALMQAQSQHLYGQSTQYQCIQAMFENQLSHIRGLLRKRLRDDGECGGGPELHGSHSGMMMMGSCCAVWVLAALMPFYQFLGFVSTAFSARAGHCVRSWLFTLLILFNVCRIGETSSPSPVIQALQPP